MTAPTLTEFLLARIDEDEAAARGSQGGMWATTGGPRMVSQPEETDNWEPVAPGWVLVDPARVLAECEARRRIVEIHHPHDHHGEHGDYAFCDACQWDHGDDSPRIDTGIDEFGKACRTLRALASVYSDHPDFDEAWRA